MTVNVFKNKMFRLAMFPPLSFIGPMCVNVIILAVFSVFLGLLTNGYAYEHTDKPAPAYVLANGHLFAPLFQITATIAMVAMLALFGVYILSLLNKKHSILNISVLSTDIVYLNVCMSSTVLMLILLWGQTTVVNILALIGIVLLMWHPLSRLSEDIMREWIAWQC